MTQQLFVMSLVLIWIAFSLESVAQNVSHIRLAMEARNAD